MNQVKHEFVNNNTVAISCNCTGPQNGEPLCPCEMKDVLKMHGRYVRIQDLGPVIETDEEGR